MIKPILFTVASIVFLYGLSFALKYIPILEWWGPPTDVLLVITLLALCAKSVVEWLIWIEEQES